MIKNYLKIAWRTLLRQKLYSLINIVGLATGLCICMLIMLYVAHELSFDRFHANADKIFALDEHAKMGGNTIQFANTNYITGPSIQQSDPAVAAFMRLHSLDEDAIVENPALPNTRFAEKKMLFADANFFYFFSFKLLSGNAKNVLSKPYSLVISQRMAKKYFGSQNPVGKTLKIGMGLTYQVNGVAENAPSNSTINFDFVASNSSLSSLKGNEWMFTAPYIGSGAFKTYLRLKQTGDTARVHRTMQQLLKKDKEALNADMRLTALPDIHLKSNYGDFSNIKYLKIFPLTAALILLLALVNYMSLATARSTLRAKEVGVRKVNGASRRSIAVQFYIESAVYTVLSFLLGYAMCYALKDSFLNILQLKMDTSFLYSPLVIAIMFTLLILTIFIAGLYPSVVLSAYKPVVTLKGKMSKQAGGVLVRKVFTTLQFAIAVGLIICGIVIDRQLYFFRHKDTGVNRENIVMIPTSRTLGSHYQSFKKDVEAIAGISQVAIAHTPMYKTYDAIFTNSNQKNQGIPIFMFNVDQNFIPELKIKWKIPPISTVALTGARKIVINETALAKLNLPANPIGKIIDADQKYEVVGVVKDFNEWSMERAIDATGFFVAADTVSKWGMNNGYLYAKISPHSNVPSVLAALQTVYRKYDALTPFDFNFLDDAYNQQYKAEDRLSSIFSVFTLVTILLATLGLFGLAAFTIEQRTKEIGIRKVLGAGLATIATLLSVDFLKLVVLAILIASPVAWWAMHSWLQNFEYRIAIQWWVFILAGLLAIAVAMFTISYHAIKAAVLNPVKGLRSE